MMKMSPIRLLNAVNLTVTPRHASTFRYADLKIEKTKTPSRKPDWEKLQFGHNFADHMLMVKWSQQHGWEKPLIKPLAPLELHPAAKILHYAPGIFEGLKAYYGAGNKVRLFRPDENAKRMNSSAIRASLPEFDSEELVRCIKKLVQVDEDFVPKSKGKSLYVRPTMIGVTPTLGVYPPEDVLLYVLTSPVGAYYPTGIKPVSLLADASYVRSWPGGTGEAKMAANYAGTTYIQLQAVKQQCQQVLWLYGNEHFITEVGTMNFFVLWRNAKGEKELLTPPLNGLILPGVTRKSILELARQWGDLRVTEAEITMEDLLSAAHAGRLMEVFGSGTACVVCPVESILYEGTRHSIPVDTKGVSMRLLKELNDIQYGTKPHPWAQTLDV